MTFWILMLARVNETAGLPMAVFTDKAACERQVVVYKQPAEMRWYCIGVIMPKGAE